jgi:hypothetical protein
MIQAEYPLALWWAPLALSLVLSRGLYYSYCLSLLRVNAKSKHLCKLRLSLLLLFSGLYGLMWSEDRPVFILLFMVSFGFELYRTYLLAETWLMAEDRPRKLGAYILLILLFQSPLLGAWSLKQRAQALH